MQRVRQCSMCGAVMVPHAPVYRSDDAPGEVFCSYRCQCDWMDEQDVSGDEDD